MTMQNNDLMPSTMGLTPEMYARYSREYMRLNPHDLPELRRRTRRRFTRVGVPEMVYSTRRIAFA